MNLFLECPDRENLTSTSDFTPDFVCRRGFLTKICAIPYTYTNQWDRGMTVSIQKVGCTYYMLEVESENSMSEELKKMAYGGKNLEELMSTSPAGTQNLNDEYVSIRKTKFGAHSLIIRGEIDGCRPDKEYVEMTTTTTAGKGLGTDKEMKLWLQCYLLGINKILLGYRENETGLVRQIEWIKVENLVKGSLSWEPERCFRHLKKFLDLKKSEDGLSYSFKRNMGSEDFMPHRETFFVQKVRAGPSSQVKRPMF